MLAFYPQIHSVHVWAIGLSGAWMALRGMALLAGMNWPRRALAWSVGLAIDGTVLTAAAMLLTILPEAMFANHWLMAKLVCVASYFAAGYRLLLTRPSRGRQLLLLFAAMTAYALAYGIARAHHPLGWWEMWGS